MCFGNAILVIVFMENVFLCPCDVHRVTLMRILYSISCLLAKDIETSLHKAIIFIKCVCILHNFIRERDRDSDLDYIRVTTKLNVGNGNDNPVPDDGRCRLFE